MGAVWQMDAKSRPETGGMLLTCMLIVKNFLLAPRVAEWEAGIIAPRLTPRALANELHYHFRRYLDKGYFLLKIAPFLFLNLVQRILYTYGFFIGRYKRCNSGRKNRASPNISKKTTSTNIYQFQKEVYSVR